MGSRDTWRAAAVPSISSRIASRRIWSALPGVTVHPVRAAVGRASARRAPARARGRRRARRSAGPACVLVNGGNARVPARPGSTICTRPMCPRAGSLGAAVISSARAQVLSRAGTRRAAACLRSSSATAGALRRTWSASTASIRSRVRVVYYGIDAGGVSRHRPPRSGTPRERRSASADRRVAVFIGALGDRRKGFDVLFDAWRGFAAGPAWDIDLFVAGAGAERDGWMARAREAGPRRAHSLPRLPNRCRVRARRGRCSRPPGALRGVRPRRARSDLPRRAGHRHGMSPASRSATRRLSPDSSSPIRRGGARCARVARMAGAASRPGASERPHSRRISRRVPGTTWPPTSSRPSNDRMPAFVDVDRCWVCEGTRSRARARRVVRVVRIRDSGSAAGSLFRRVGVHRAMHAMRLCAAVAGAGAAALFRSDVRPAMVGGLDRPRAPRRYKDVIFADILDALARRLPPARRRLLDVGAHAGSLPGARAPRRAGTRKDWSSIRGRPRLPALRAAVGSIRATCTRSLSADEALRRARAHRRARARAGASSHPPEGCSSLVGRRLDCDQSAERARTARQGARSIA